MITSHVKVRNMESPNGNDVPNQFIIETPNGTYFQSYRTVIAFVPNHGNEIYLDKNAWDCSVTTGKYRNLFLGENKKETERKIKSGKYVLVDWLNEPNKNVDAEIFWRLVGSIKHR